MTSTGAFAIEPTSSHVEGYILPPLIAVVPRKPSAMISAVKVSMLLKYDEKRITFEYVTGLFIIFGPPPPVQPPTQAVSSPIDLAL